MLDYITGTLTEVDAAASEVVVETHGIGFRMSVPTRVLDTLPPPGKEVTVYLEMVAGERDISLYGFADPAQRAFFRLIRKHVKNVGPALAMRVLSRGSVGEMREAVLRQEVDFFSMIKGIGKKTAERIVRELRDAVAALPAEARKEGAEGLSSVRSDALKALVALGIPEQAAAARVNAVIESAEGPLDVETVIKKALAAPREAARGNKGGTEESR